MPRPIIGAPLTANAILSCRAPVTAPRSTLHVPRLDERLRTKRSKAYVEAMSCLDAGTHHADRSALDGLIKAIAEEFPDLGIDERPIGIVSRCFLGAPYEVHICDLDGSIIEHFQTYRAMPPRFEAGRTLALHPLYAFVEVYPTALRAVSQDGSVSVIEQ